MRDNKQFVCSTFRFAIWLTVKVHSTQNMLAGTAGCSCNFQCTSHTSMVYIKRIRIRIGGYLLINWNENIGIFRFSCFVYYIYSIFGQMSSITLYDFHDILHLFKIKMQYKHKHWRIVKNPSTVWAQDWNEGAIGSCLVELFRKKTITHNHN